VHPRNFSVQEKKLTWHHRCLGRAFAVTNIKVLLVVILRKFAFELPEGPATQFEQILTAVARVRTKGQEGSKVLMRVRRID
jgi:hypothetical protein